MESRPADRKSEWFVPQFGPERFRSLVGLLFLPYTGMVLSFAAIGSMVADPIYWDRVLAITVIYFLGLGIGAHALDAAAICGARGLDPALRQTGLHHAAVYHRGRPAFKIDRRHL